MKEIAILGSGPSAAFAYQACLKAGYGPHEIFVATAKLTEPPAGAFWFHWVPNHIRAVKVPIVLKGVGTEEGYLSKQWRRHLSGVPSSFPKTEQRMSGYPVSRYVWRQMWEGADILPGFAFTDQAVRDLAQDFEKVIQTFPSKAAIHAYRDYTVLYPTVVYEVAHEWPEWEKFLHSFSTEILYSPQGVYCLYNGLAHDDWVRATYSLGKVMVEYPWYTPLDTLPTEGTVLNRDIVPWAGDLDPMPPAENVLMVGRYATWQRKQLSHETFGIVSGWLNAATTTE